LGYFFSAMAAFAGSWTSLRVQTRYSTAATDMKTSPMAGLSVAADAEAAHPQSGVCHVGGSSARKALRGKTPITGSARAQGVGKRHEMHQPA